MDSQKQENSVSEFKIKPKYYGFILGSFVFFSLVGILVARYIIYPANPSGKIDQKENSNNRKGELKTPSTSTAESPILSNTHSSISQSQAQSDLDNAKFLNGQQHLELAYQRLMDVNKIEENQKGLKVTDQALLELKKSREMLMSVSQANVNFQSAKQYLNLIDEYETIASSWKEEFIQRAKNPTHSDQPSNSVNQNPQLSRNIPELSIKHKSSFLLAMKPKTAVLTFDDGPTQEYTPQILDVLNKNNVKATFFVVGKRVKNNCGILREIYQAGHEIGNHTETHPYLTKISEDEQIREIQNTQAIVSQCLGFNYQINWFRAPYGDQNLDLLNTIHRLGLKSAQWIVDTRDWQKSTSTSNIVYKVKSSPNPGVVLMHDGSLTNPNFIHPDENPSRQNTVNSLDPIIKNLQNRGFTLVPLSYAFR